MRILWYGPYPDMPTGYATQSALILPRLKAMGHEVAVSATAGQDSRPGWWQGIPVYPCTPYAEVGQDTVVPNYQDFKADIVFTFLCTWLLEKYPAVWRGLRTVHLTPVDCTPMSAADHAVIIETNGTPAAISRFGLEQMQARGLDPLFLPHGIDTRCFTPSPDRDAMRADMGYAGKFVVGMNFMNNDPERKNIDPAFGGFAKFHAKHPDSVLAVHAIQALPEGYVLPELAAHLGIADAVAWSPQSELVRGMITPAMLSDWYNALDVYLGPGNEGFGLPHVEAQACGTPVILGDYSTGPELVGPGWLTGGQRYYNRKHKADWMRASEDGIAAALEEAYEDARNRREAARDFAAGFDINKVVRDHWEPVLAALG
jgi:glycosyltransferase involved in cell wall biosynthesis